MTIPGDGSTGSTVLHDLQAFFDGVAFYGIIGVYLLAMIVPVVLVVGKLISELRKK